MTARDRAQLRDRVARRQVEISAAPLPAAASDARAAAGRSALAALHEAERRHSGRRRIHGDVGKRNPRPATPRPAGSRPRRDLARTLAELAKVAGESARAARVVAALPPLDLIASDVDPVAHVRNILGAAA